MGPASSRVAFVALIPATVNFSQLKPIRRKSIDHGQHVVYGVAYSKLCCH